MEAWAIVFLATVVFLAVFGLALGLGAIIAGKKLQGSCGGMVKLVGRECWFCPKRDRDWAVGPRVS